MTSGHVHLTGYMQAPADRIEAVLLALPQHIALTRAEPGCIAFDVTPSPEHAGRFLVRETFRDQAAFDAHQARAAASPWAAVTQGLARHYTITTL